MTCLFMALPEPDTVMEFEWGGGRRRGHKTETMRSLAGQNDVWVQSGPEGLGRAGRPQKNSPVCGEGVGTSTVVQAKGER